MFRSDIRQWKSVADFRAHLGSHHSSVAWWALGVTLHHTWKPRRQDWRGYKSMESLRNFYTAKGWDSGPHLFIAYGSPDPANDGI